MRAALLVLACALTSTAQVPLSEQLKSGTVLRHELTLQLSGKMKFERGGGVDFAPLEATGRLVFAERYTSATESMRHYSEAASRIVVGVDKDDRILSPDHRLIAVARNQNGVTCLARSPLTRDELGLVSEHLDPARLPALLPGKTVNVDDAWPIPDDVAAALCHFDGLVKHSLTGKLVETTDKAAMFTVTGEAEGIECGAKAKLTIAARGEFDRAAGRIVKLTWEQTDERAAGPVSPALSAKVTVTLLRSELTAEPAELAESQRNLIPRDELARERLLRLVYRHPDGKYELSHSRDWHAVVQTESHLVLRLVLRGELIAQATVTPWKAAVGADVIREFTDATAKQNGWAPGTVIASGELPATGGKTVFRHVVQGRQDAEPVVQSFFLISAADGRRAAIACVTRPEMVEKLGSGDAALAAGLEFPPAK